ncbi:MAG: hypothetical protein GX783_11120 [Clostridiales bacterium]|nr:hypothetical protein [Clostridiales bacterium]
MYRIWGILRKNNKIIAQAVVSNEDDRLSNEEKLQECIQQICYELDLQRPIWLPKNDREFEKYNRAVLNQDNFMEAISFDSFEVELLVEDKKQINN